MKLKALVEKLQEIIKENPDVDFDCWIRQEQINHSNFLVYSTSDFPAQQYKLEVSNRHNVELEIYLDNDNKFETWQKKKQ